MRRQINYSPYMGTNFERPRRVHTPRRPRIERTIMEHWRNPAKNDRKKLNLTENNIKTYVYLFRLEKELEYFDTL